MAGRTELEQLVYSMSVDIKNLERQNRRALGEINNTAKRAEDRYKKMAGNLNRDFYQPMQIASTVALGAIVGFSVQAARRAEAVDGAFRQTFRDMPTQATAAVDKIADDFKRLETDVKDNFTQLRSVIVALGVDGEQSLAIVDQLQRRSLDIAAFKDVSDADAFRAVISGITGETEPLKRFGIVVNETAVKAELMRLGFKGNAQQASEAAKVIARTNIILRQSAEMQGQVAREADTLAEQEKRTRVEFTKAAEDFGKKFLPVAKDVLEWASDCLGAFNSLPDGVQTAGLALLALVAVSGPIGSAIKGLQALIGAAVAARAALAAIGGSAAARGAAGRGGLLAAGGLGLGGAATIGTGIMLGTTSFAPAPYQGTDLDRQLAQARTDRDRARGLANDTFLKSSDVVRQQRETLSRRNARVAELERQVQARDAARMQADLAAAKAEADAAATNALANLGDFGLSAAQQRPTGGGTTGGGRSDAAERERVAQLREQLELEERLAAARATGDDKAIKVEEERQRLIELTKQYRDGEYEDAIGRAMALLAAENQAEMISEERERSEEARREAADQEAEARRRNLDWTERQLNAEIEIASLGGDDRRLRALEREAELRQRIADYMERYGIAGAGLALAEQLQVDRARADGDAEAAARGAARTFVDVISADDPWEAAGQAFRRAAWDGLEDTLTGLFKGFLNGGAAGVGGFLRSLIPGFAGGVENFGGGLAYVHKGEVLTNLPKGANVIPANRVRMGAAIPTSGAIARAAVTALTATIRIDLDGANGDDAIRRIAHQAAAEGSARAVAQATTLARRGLAADQQRLRRLGAPS